MCFVALALGCAPSAAESSATTTEAALGDRAGQGAPRNPEPPNPEPPNPENGAAPAPTLVIPEATLPPSARAELPPADKAGSCPGGKGHAKTKGLGLMVTPRRARVDGPVEILAASFDEGAPIAVRVESPSGAVVALTGHTSPGTPVSTRASFVAEESGVYQVVIGRDGVGLSCTKFAVQSGKPSNLPPPLDATASWPITRSWGPAEEALYSAWVRELFWGPPGVDLAWPRLDKVTQDRERNPLHDALGWNEDSDKNRGLILVPDCADTPYFLRAYFAWKRGLPFAFHRCSRGQGGAPTCYEARGNLDAPELKPEWAASGLAVDQLMVINRFFRRTVAWGVHSGNGRVAYGDSRGDFYPVRLDARGLRPGVIYADPYGHLLVVVELVPQAGSVPGVLYAIDGQPDGSITRKRFWEGNFMWNPDPSLGGAGFKAFRPVIRVDNEGVVGLEVNDDAAIARRKDYPDADGGQRLLNATQFYAAVEAVINPQPIDPAAALVGAVTALHEQAKVRVTSVQNGNAWHREHQDEIIPMPLGHSVFETTGSWEDFSTPSRDLRLLIAIDVVEGFEAKVAATPVAYGLSAGPALDAALAELGAIRAALLADSARAIEYRRSDDTKWSLPLSELVKRKAALEAGYNPNDCPEARWGASEGSDEYAPCDRRAPSDQVARMEAYRVWFRDRKRPPRGDEGPPVDVP